MLRPSRKEVEVAVVAVARAVGLEAVRPEPEQAPAEARQERAKAAMAPVDRERHHPHQKAQQAIPSAAPTGGVKAQQASKLETRAFFTRSQGGTVTRGQCLPSAICATRSKGPTKKSAAMFSAFRVIYLLVCGLKCGYERK